MSDVDHQPTNTNINTNRYRLSVRAYPRHYRLEHGAELVATANDLSPNRWSPRQAWSLLTEGLRTRARLGANSSPAVLWSQGLALGLVLMVIPIAAHGLTWLLGAPDTFTATTDPVTPWISGPGGLLVLTVLTRTTRWPAAAIVTVWITGLIGWASRGPADLVEALAFVVGPMVVVVATGWWVALRSNGAAAISTPMGLGALTALVSAALLAPHPHFVIEGPYWLGVVGLGLALAFVDPRLLIAASVDTLVKLAALVSGSAAMSIGGSSQPISETTLASLPLLLTVVVGLTLGRRQLRRLLPN